MIPESFGRPIGEGVEGATRVSELRARWVLSVLVCSTVLACSFVSEDMDVQAPRGVGYTELEFFDPERSRTLETTLWYPAEENADPASAVYPSSFLGYAKRDAAVFPGSERRPLILLSHGDRGTRTNLAWLAERLAVHGYLAAGVDHWLNTTRNNEPEEALRMWNRPADISFVLDQLLADPIWGKRINPDRIGVAGHSSGGYTAFALAGAVFDPEAMAAYCQTESAGPDCALAEDADLTAVDYSRASDSYRDARIDASFAMAPAVGAGIQVSSLAEIEIPVHVVTTRDDELLDPERNAMFYARNTPSAGITVYDGGGHFVYLSRCSVLAKVFTYFMEFDVCGNRSAVDRDPVHREIAGIALTFFDDNWDVASEGPGG